MCVSPGGPVPSPGACVGWFRSTDGGPLMALPPALQPCLKPKWCTYGLAREHEKDDAAA